MGWGGGGNLAFHYLEPCAVGICMGWGGRESLGPCSKHCPSSAERGGSCSPSRFQSHIGSPAMDGGGTARLEAAGPTWHGELGAEQTWGSESISETSVSGLGR